MAILLSHQKRRVILVQPNFQYGDNVFVPYSIGRLQAYAQTVEDIRQNFHFEDLIFLRENPLEVVKRMNNPSVVGFSCYIWNWEYNKTLARLVKEAFPDCLIIFGGSQIPDASEGFFVEHPYVDILVHNEGEFAFAAILLESPSLHPDYSKIPSLSVRMEGNRTHKLLSHERVLDLSRLPSPYLSGVFDFMLGRGRQLSASQETNRGCPYQCTFCAWGGAKYNKVVLLEEAQILDEFEWFGRNRISYLFNCDANYGIRDRDVQLTEEMIRTRERHHGHPEKFRMCTAKNGTDRIFTIVKMLNDAGMSKGATLSFQSMDKETLVLVERRNIGIDRFIELMDRYRKASIGTYTELIMGMPGETYESTKEGIDTLLDAEAEAVNIFAYVCAKLPDTKMSDPDYVAKHEIHSVRMPILLAHSTPDPELLPEYSDVVVGTATMSTEDWERTYLFYWAIQCFHCLGITRYISIFLHDQLGVRYSDFYEGIMNHFEGKTETLIGREIEVTKEIVHESLSGGRLDIILPRFGDIYWPLEEASFLNLICEKEKLYQEMRLFIEQFLEDRVLFMDGCLLDDLIAYESTLIMDPYTSEFAITLQHDIHGYFERRGESTDPPDFSPSQLFVTGEKSFLGDLKHYATEVPWYGRKGGRFHHRKINVVRVNT